MKKKKRICGLVVAAGLSRRMETFKPFLPLKGKTIIENTIDSVLMGGADTVVVVAGYRGAELEELLCRKYQERVIIAWNFDFAATDMLYSIQLGCRSLPECDAFFLLPGDMPVIKKSTFEKVLEVWKANSYDIVFPTVDGSRKHPPLIAASLIPEILQFHGEGGLRQLWKRYGDRIGLVPVDDKGTGMDLDTREDYRFCKEQYEIGAVKTNDSKGVTEAMTIEIFHTLPEAAVSIRKKVFMEEQGFQKEFDEIDERAVHLVLFDDKGAAAATCRVFYDTALESYILGRLAVVKEYRGQKLGAAMIAEAEKYVCSVQGEYLALHAQCRVKEFYQKMGFREYGEVEDDEGCPHIWMKKKL